jgi:hypothetical protein
MAENQKSSTGSGNQESKSQQPSGTSKNTADGKAKGMPSNIRNEETDMSKKNKEGNPDESKIQGDEKGRSESDLNRSGGERESNRRNGGSL